MPNYTETVLLRLLGDASGAEQALSSINKSLAKFGAALTAASDAALLTFVKLGEQGAVLEDVEDKFDRATRAFGFDAKQLLSSWKDAAQGALTQAGLMRKANYLMLTGVPVGEMEWMLEAVRNASAATGRSFEDLFDKMAMGLARNSKLLLDDLGIIVSVGEANIAYANSLGISKDALTEQQKKLAFVAAAREAATRQEEVLGKAMESSAAVIYRAKTALTDLKDEISKYFVPVAKAGAKAVLFFKRIFDAIPAPVKAFTAKLLALLAAAGAIIGPILTVVALMPIVKVALGAAVAAIGPILPILLAVTRAVALVTAVVALAAKAWRENWGGIQDTVRFVIDTIKPYLDGLVHNFRYWSGLIKEELAGIMAAIRAIVEPFIARIRELLGDGAGLMSFMMTLRDAVNVILGVVHAMLETIRLLLEGEGDDAWAPLADAGVNVLTLIVVVWRKYIRNALVWGWNLIVNLANGIIRAGQTVLQQAATYIGNILSGFFESHSPPKKGPLSGIVQWGKGLMETYLRAFGLADFGILRDVLAPMQAAIDAAVGLGNIDQVDAIKVFREIRAEVAGLIADFRKTGVISDEVLGSIADKLGEGGREYAEYLRLTLEHQKALGRLKDVQAEYDAADAKGFIPAELKAKLAAAEDEVTSAQDAAEWQREYLAALQDGIDIEREMVDALKALTETLKGGKGGAGTGSVEGAAKIDWGGGEGGAGPFAGFGGFSGIFDDTKAEVEAWLAEFPEKLATWWEGVKLKIATFGLEIITKTRTTLLRIGAVLAWKFLELRLKIRNTLLMIVAILAFKYAEITGKIHTTIQKIRAIVVGFFYLMYIKLLVFFWKVDFWVKEKVANILLAIAGFITDFSDAGRNLITGLWDGLKEKWEELKAWFGERLTDLPEWMRKLLKIESPSKVMAEIGRQMAAGIQVGFDLQATKDSVAGMVGGLGNFSLTGEGVKVFQFNGALEFPNVRDGRDRDSFVEELLQKATDAGKVRSMVPGGVMG